MSRPLGATEFVGRAVVVAITLVALAIIGVAAERQLRSVGHRFPGFALYGSRTVDRLNQPYWTGIRAGLRPGDQILAANGHGVATLAEISDLVTESSEGSLIRYSVRRGARTFELQIPTMRFRWIDFVESYALYAGTALIFMLGGAAIAWFRVDAFGLAIFSFSAAIALTLGGGIQLALHDPYASEGRLSMPLVAAAILHLAMVFPEMPPFVRRRPSWVALPYVAMLPLVLARIQFALSGARPPAIVDGLSLAAPMAAGFALLFAFVRARRLWTHGMRARRVRVVQTGLALAVVIHAVGFAATEIGWMPPAPNLTFLLPAWVWISTMTIASIKLDVFDLGSARRAELARGFVFVVTVTLYMTAFGIAAFAARSAGSDPRIWVLAAGFLLAGILAYTPLNWLARQIVERPVAGSSRLRSGALREISERLAAALDLGAIEDAAQAIALRFALNAVRVFAGDGKQWPHGLAGPLAAELASPAQVLLGALAAAPPPSEGESEGSLGPELDSEECRRALESLAMATMLGLRSNGRLLGGLGIGAPLHGGVIPSADLGVLTALAEQVALALENVRTLERIRDLERALSAENVVLKEELLAKPGPGGLVGRSAPMRQLHAWIEQAGPTDATVLLRGETGTGKELVARALHPAGRRNDRPMVRINCAAVPAGLLETEFFGYEKGAFTGAHARKLGRFELADGGTLFLDEIGDLPEELQPKLLRVLQEHQFERVGGAAPVSIDVRLIAATNRDLEALVRRGRFREDLFFRLNVVPFTVPPLRERREDVPALVAHFLRAHESKTGRVIRGIDQVSLRALLGYRWPGNVRELENVIERAMILSQGENLMVRDPSESARPEAVAERLRPLAEQLQNAKVRSIRRALARSGGNQARAAELLGLRPSSLSRMIKQLGLRAAPGAARRGRSKRPSSGAADSA